MRSLVVVALVFLGGCATVRPCPHLGGEAWREVTSAHFVVQTNLGSDAAKTTALHLEKYRRALLLAFGDRFDPPGKLRVIVPRSQAEFDQFTDQSLGGYFRVASSDGPMIVMPGQSFAVDSAALPETVAHELAHYLSRFVFVRQPRWFAEGIASYLESTYVRANGVEVEIGRPGRHYLIYLMQNGRTSPENMWAWDKASPSSFETTQLYATSFLWTHFLMNEHTDRFAAFQTSLAMGEEPGAAWKQAFAGVSQDELITQVATFAKLGRYRVSVLKLPKVDPSVTERPLSDADVHAIRAELFRSTPGNATEVQRLAQIRREVDSALAADPWHTGAHEFAIAMMEDKAKRIEQARSLTVQRPKDARAFLLFSDTALEAELAEERVSALERAVFLAPEDPRALNNLAWEYAARGVSAQSLSLAAKAVKLAPWNPNYVDTLAFAAARAGRCSDAKQLQVRALERLHETAPQEVRDDYRKRLARYERGCEGLAAGTAP